MGTGIVWLLVTWLHIPMAQVPAGLWRWIVLP
jgi:hypothetical protein